MIRPPKERAPDLHGARAGNGYHSLTAFATPFATLTSTPYQPG